MAVQKQKRKLLAEIVCIFECLLTRNPTNQGSQLSWFFQTIWKTVKKIKKSGALGSYFCLKMISKLVPQNSFPKKHLDFGGLETNQRHEI